MEAKAIKVLQAHSAAVHTFNTKPEWIKVIVGDHSAWLWERAESVAFKDSDDQIPQMMPAVEKLWSLKSLSVAGSPIRDSDLAQFKGLKAMQELNLSQTLVTDAGLAELKRFPSLQTLKLDQTFITDAGLARLKGLKTLRVLEIEDTKTTDAGLVNFRGLTKLRFLSLMHTAATKTGVGGLQQALPNCVFHFDPAALPRFPKGYDIRSLLSGRDISEFDGPAIELPRQAIPPWPPTYSASSATNDSGPSRDNRVEGIADVIKNVPGPKESEDYPNSGSSGFRRRFDRHDDGGQSRQRQDDIGPLGDAQDSRDERARRLGRGEAGGFGKVPPANKRPIPRQRGGGATGDRSAGPQATARLAI